MFNFCSMINCATLRHFFRIMGTRELVFNFVVVFHFDVLACSAYLLTLLIFNCNDE